MLARSDGDIVNEVRELTRGQGCNCVFDGVGQPTIALSIACCRRRGAVVLHGALGQPVASISPDDLAAAGSVFLTRVHLPDFMQDQTEVRWRTGDVFSAWQAGKLKVRIARIVTGEEIGEAFALVESGAATGKALMRL